MKHKKIEILDSTLRDGTQAEGIFFSFEDKVKIARKLDELGVDYIEAGCPYSNPKDSEVFVRLKQEKFVNAKVVAFGSTRKKNTDVTKDEAVVELANSFANTITVYGKTWQLPIEEVLVTTLEENLNMIRDTISYLVACGKKVLFDAEHFFNAFVDNQDYALEVVKCAFDAGADCVVLCDTNGAFFPMKIYEIVKYVVEIFEGKKIGIHCHDDKGLAVANTIMAVEAGAIHVQGTIIGVGERCGNASLTSVIPNLQLSYNFDCIPETNLSKLTAIANYISDVANIKLKKSTPYVGKSAFAHKAGTHADAVSKEPEAFEHIEPEIVGNKRKILVSEVSGRANLLPKIQEICSDVSKDSYQVGRIIDLVKKLESEGFTFEAAEASLELMIMKELGLFKPFFELVNYKVINEMPSEENNTTTASVKIRVGEMTGITSDEGDGPVNALDKAMRKAIEEFYPIIASVHLVDYKVRVFETLEATAASVRVLIESTDGEDMWTTVGASTDIIKASWIALEDSINYKLMKG